MSTMQQYVRVEEYDQLTKERDELKAKLKAAQEEDWTPSLIDRLNEFARENRVDFAEVRNGAEASSVIQEMHGRYNALLSERDVLRVEAKHLRIEKEQAESSRDFCREWYSQRFERLSQFIREEIPEPQKTRYFSIIANGAADVHEQNTYGYQMNLLRIEKEQAEAKAAALLECFGESRPWTLIDILHTLSGWVDHLQKDHDCDHNGHEVATEAVKESKIAIEKIMHAISTDCGKAILARVKVLRQFIAHRPSCASFDFPSGTRSCDCGFAEALAETEEQ